MRGGPNRRFPRTAGSIPQDRPTIEREKIRHRRPDDNRTVIIGHDDADQEPPPSPYQADDLDQADDQASPWSEEGEDWPDQEPDQEEGWPAETAETAETKDWDDDADDEWVFENTPPDETVADDQATDRGVIWEDDDIEIGSSHDRQGLDDDGEDGFAPEVELAARRDIRPRPPKSRSKQQNRPAPVDRQKPPPANRAQQRPVRQQYVDEEDDVALGKRPSPIRRVTAAEAGGSRFSRTQATIENQVAPAPPKLRQPPQQKRRASSKRVPPQPRTIVPPARFRRGRWRRSLTMLTVIALLIGGGWYVYRALDNGDLSGQIQAWVQQLGLPGSGGRTASDTAFDTPSPSEATVPPEEALSDLTSGEADDIRATEVPALENGSPIGSQTGGPLTPEQDPAAFRVEGPPIPKFKPRDRTPTLSPQPAPIEIEKAVEEPSTLEQIWGYLVKG